MLNKDIIAHGLSWVQAALDCKTWTWDGDQREAAIIELAAAHRALADMPTEPKPIVSIKKMTMSGGRADYYVSIQVGGKDVTPHKFSEEYVAAYHVALYEWLLNGGAEPDLMAFGPDTWPAVKMVEVMPVDPKGPFAAGVWEAVRWVEKRRDDYIREHGSYDPETGATEFPDDGEYAGELDEIVEGLQKLAGV